MQKNYLLVYPYEKWESSQPLPQFTVGEAFEPTEANITEGQTTPPGYLTEPELISLMDANGIGTDATMAEHIAKIKEREYVLTQTRSGDGQGDTDGRGSRGGRGQGGRGSRGGRGGAAARGGGSVQQFIPTTLGVALIEGYDSIGLDTSLGKPFLRKEMEVKMKEICAGRKSRNDFVHETLDQYRDAFVRTQQQVEVLKTVCEQDNVGFIAYCHTHRPVEGMFLATVTEPGESRPVVHARRRSQGDDKGIDSMTHSALAKADCNCYTCKASG